MGTDKVLISKGMNSKLHQLFRGMAGVYIAIGLTLLAYSTVGPASLFLVLGIAFALYGGGILP